MVSEWHTDQIPQPPRSKEAPWKETFLADVMAMEGHEFAFSTLHSPEESDETTPAPRVRFCAFRSFWAELPKNDSNPAPRNKATFKSDMPAFTTDVRTEKISDLFSGDDDNQQGAGGGKLYEAVWWARGSMRQWRIRGRAFVIAPDIESDRISSLKVRRELGSRMYTVNGEVREPGWWGRELTGHFGNLSPAMRGRFVAPPPGQPVDEPYDHENLKAGQEIHDVHRPIARKHFRVVVIVPDEVEVLEMSPPETARRHFYTFNNEDRSWSHRECWP